MQLSNAIQGYWLSRKRDLSVNTQRDYSLTFKRLQEYMGDPEFCEVDGKSINLFLDHLAEEYELGKKTLLNVWIALSALWSWAEVELKTKHVVREYVNRPNPKAAVVKPYTKDEVQRILDACEWFDAWAPALDASVKTATQNAIRDKAIIMLMVDSGLRVSEVCALTIGDYDPRRGQVMVRHGKGDKKRVVYLGDTSRKMIWRYLADRKKPQKDDPLFVTREGTHLWRNNVRRAIALAGERSGVEGATCHRFRHTFAINFLRNGGNLFALQEMLGHSSLEMVKRYAKIAELDLETAQKRASVADNWRL